MIGITVPTYDLNGFAVLDSINNDASTTRDLTRRATRTATLDGAAVLNDLGFSDSDRTITVNVFADESLDSTLNNMVKYYSTVYLYMGADVFLANPKRLSYVRNGSVTLTLEIITKET